MSEYLTTNPNELKDIEVLGPFDTDIINGMYRVVAKSGRNGEKITIAARHTYKSAVELSNYFKGTELARFNIIPFKVEL